MTVLCGMVHNTERRLQSWRKENVHGEAKCPNSVHESKPHSLTNVHGFHMQIKKIDGR